MRALMTVVEHGHAEVLVFDVDVLLGHFDGVEPGFRDGVLPEGLGQGRGDLHLVVAGQARCCAPP